MAVLAPNLASPHKVVYIPFGSTATPAGTAVVASSVYRIWMTDATSEILAIQLVRQTGAAGSVTYQAGFIPVTTATGALTVLASSAVTDTTAGLITLPIDADANDAAKGTTVPPGTVIGFTTNSGSVTTTVLQGVLIRYRSV